MSLILDALNRSREDNGTVPGLGTRHEFTDERADRRVLALGTILVFALVAIAWLVWDKREEVLDTAGIGQQGAAEEAAAAPLQPEVVQKAAVTMAPKAALEAIPPVEREPALAGVEQVPVMPANKVVAKPLVAAAPDQELTATEIEALYQPATAALPKANASIPAPRPVTGAVREERDMDIGQLVSLAESELKDAQLAEHPAPFINHLSQQTKDAIPTIYYQRHEYSGRAAQSRVVLNGKKLQKGGSPVAGVRVEEILPDSVVLSYDGTQFRLRALNSWVNL